MNLRFERLGRVVLFSLLVAFSTSAAMAGEQAAPKNIILLIGDGMGPEQIRSASLYGFGKVGALSFESLPAQAEVITTPVPPAKKTTTSSSAPATKKATSSTSPAWKNITDSAAAATAMATGRKVRNEILSVTIDGDDITPIPTILEYYQAQGKRTGLVTTSYIADATPAGFAAHVKNRKMFGAIAEQMLAAKVNVLFGGGAAKPEYGMSPAQARAAGYTVAVDRKQLLAMDPAKGTNFAGLFGTGRMPLEFNYAVRAEAGYDRLPHLSEMAAKTLELLDNDNGFFVMIEGGNIDSACHANNLQGAIYDTLEFHSAVRTVLDWAKGRTDTLIIVVADHETGGLSVLEDRGRGNWPLVSWTTKGHTGIHIKLFATGPGSQNIQGVIDNTDIYRIMKGTYVAPATQPGSTTQPASRAIIRDDAPVVNPAYD